MSRASCLALAFAPFVISANAPSAHRFKEAACIQISAPAGSQSPRLLVTVKGEGLRIYKSSCALPVGGAFVKSDTVTAPSKLTVLAIGAGEAELVSLDPAVKYTVSIEALVGGSTESKSVTASHVIIDHHDAQQPLSIRAAEGGNR
jgi:hypothetical protein